MHYRRVRRGSHKDGAQSWDRIGWIRCWAASLSRRHDHHASFALVIERASEEPKLAFQPRGFASVRVGLIVAFFGALSLVGCSANSFETAGGFTLERSQDRCEFENSTASEVVAPTQTITYFLDDGRALLVSGESCSMVETETASFAPASQGQDAERDYLKVFFGAFSGLSSPNAYTDLEMTITFETGKTDPPKDSSFSTWVGLQPPIDLDADTSSTAAWRKANKWGNLAIHPTVQIGDLGSFARVQNTPFDENKPYVFNTYCDAGITSCPIDGPVNLDGHDGDSGPIVTIQRVYRGSDDSIYNASWVSTLRSGATDLTMVVPDSAVNAIFDDPDFCDESGCTFPVGLVENEIRATSEISPKQLVSMLPDKVEARVTASEQVNGSSDVDWDFAKSFEVTGTAVHNEVILSTADLNNFAAGLTTADDNHQIIRCLSTLFENLHESSAVVDGKQVLTWTLNKSSADCAVT